MRNMEEKEISAEKVVIREFIKDLENTANQVQTLLTEIRDSKVDLATIRAEFNFVVENVKHLSTLIKDGESRSIMTRLAVLEVSISNVQEQLKEYVSKDTSSGDNLTTKIALLEQKIEIISKELESKKIETISKELESKKKENKEDKKTETDDSEETKGKWQLYIAVASGIFTLLGSVAVLLFEYLK